MRYVRTLRGGSQPALVEASDGFFYVVKFANNLQGENLLFNEGAGNELYRACGLAGPVWKPLLATDEFLARTPGIWMQTEEGVRRPHPGWCFGSRFLSRHDARLLEILPGTSFSRIRNRSSFWLARLIDVCGEHADNRQAIFVEESLGWLDAIFVDHGHMFGGPNGDQQPRLRTSCYLDLRVYPEVSSSEHEDFLRFARAPKSDDLWQCANALPDEWKTESALQGFERCLDRLSNYNLLRNVMDTLVDAQQWRTASSRPRNAVSIKREPAFLHTRLPVRSTWERRSDVREEECCAVG